MHSIGKIHLVQGQWGVLGSRRQLTSERVRHDPWKMLIATCLLNVTSGRAARPIFVELVRRWPTPQALAEGAQSMLRQAIADISEHT
jgi:methyl-CpG-binding domain protein 4